MYKPLILNYDTTDDRTQLSTYFEDSQVAKIDSIGSQVLELVKIRNPTRPYKKNRAFVESLAQKLIDERGPKSEGNWIYYPWTSQLIHVLKEDKFIEVRTNRNKYKITDEEQQKLSTKVIGIAGISVGRALAKTAILERICGEIRIADFDVLELSNLNRIDVGIDELGVNKAISTAREISKLDPFMKVRVFRKGLNEENVNAFFLEGGKMDLFVEECDSLDINISARSHAKSLQIPVFMEASDRCMIDIERFDLEPDRPILHGLLEDVDLDDLKKLRTDEEKPPYLLKMVGLDTLSIRMRSRMLEIEERVISWPQLGSSVIMGAGKRCGLVRKILLNKIKGSGRFYVDEDTIIPFDLESADIVFESQVDVNREGLKSSDFQLEISRFNSQVQESKIPINDLRSLLEAAHSAPSGGNTQPWKWVWSDSKLYLFHDKSLSLSLLDYSSYASMVALGCSTENLVLAAGKAGYSVECTLNTELDSPLIAGFHLARNHTQIVDSLSDFIFSRQTDWSIKFKCKNLEEEILNKFQNELLEYPNFTLNFVCSEKGKTKLANELSEVERIRLLHPQGYVDFVGEIKSNEDEADYERTGVDLDTIKLSKSELTGMAMIKDSKLMDEVLSLGGGSTFGRLAKKFIQNSPAIGILSSKNSGKDIWYNAGRIVERLWLRFEELGLGFQPQSPLSFLKEENPIKTVSKGSNDFNATISSIYKRVIKIAELSKHDHIHFVFWLNRKSLLGPKSKRLPIDQHFIRKNGTV